MADLVVFNQSQEASSEYTASSIMEDKKWLNVIDQNNGSYQSGQMTLETTSLSTSDRLMNYREAYLAIPLVITVANVTDNNTSGLTGVNNSKVVGLKNSYTSLIHSMSVDLNGTNIIQTNPFSEFYNAFNLMTTLSWEDVKTQGSTIGFYPDDALSATSFTADNLSGLAGATVNNQDLLTPAQEGEEVMGHIGNKGFSERLKYINYTPSAKVNGNADEVAQSAFLTQASANTLYKNSVFNLVAGGAGATPIVQIQVMAIIKLRQLHNFFNNIPLCRGLQFRFIINFNQSTTVLDKTAANAINAETVAKSQFGGVNPLMASSLKDNNGGSTAHTAGNASSVRYDLSIGRTCLDSVLSAKAGVQNSSLTQSVSLYVPSYIMNPSLLGKYISSNSSKRIDYCDFYFFKINSIGAGESFNSLITSGIRGVKSVLMIPMLQSASNGGILEYQSVQSDCGGGPTALLAQVTNFQVQIGGVNQIQSNSRYEFETFNNYFHGVNAVNGGLTDGLTSGLVGQKDWGTKYLYYYVDCNRGSEAERDTPKSVQIQGQNLSAKAVDYYVYIEFHNDIVLDVGTGNIQG